jgi:hypothetical protein
VDAARFLFHLPYFRARMELAQDGSAIRFSSDRTDERGAEARFRAHLTLLPREKLGIATSRDEALGYGVGLALTATATARATATATA